jgi:hypothetical protein
MPGAVVGAAVGTPAAAAVAAVGTPTAAAVAAVGTPETAAVGQVASLPAMAVAKGGMAPARLHRDPEALRGRQAVRSNGQGRRGEAVAMRIRGSDVDVPAMQRR